MIQPGIEIKCSEASTCIYIDQGGVVREFSVRHNKKHSKQRSEDTPDQAVIQFLSVANAHIASIQMSESSSTRDGRSNNKHFICCKNISRYRKIKPLSLYKQLALMLPNPDIPKIAPASAYGYLAYSVWETFQCENRPIARAAVKLERLGVLSIGHLVVLTRAQVSQHTFMKPDIVEAMDQKLSKIGLGFGMIIRSPSTRRNLRY